MKANLKNIAMIAAGVVFVAVFCVTLVGLASGVWPWTPKAKGGDPKETAATEATEATGNTEATLILEIDPTTTDEDGDITNLPDEDTDGTHKIPVVIITDPGQKDPEKPGQKDPAKPGQNTDGGSTADQPTDETKPGENTGSSDKSDFVIDFRDLVKKSNK